MASPESTKLTPKSPIVQDSPVFNYLSNLSPLKPPDARGSILLYGDGSCPTPEPVFTSPHLRRQPKVLKGSLQLGLSEVEKFCDNGSLKLSEKTLLTPSLLQSVELVHCNIEKCESDGSSQDQAFNSPSACVDSYFADPSKDCDDSSFSHPTFTGLPDLNSSQPTFLPQNSISTREIVEDVNPGITTKASSNSSPQSEDNQIEEEPSVLIDLNVNEGDEAMVDENMKSSESFVHLDVPDCLSFLSEDGEISEMYHEKAHPRHLSSCYHATVDSGMRRTETFQWGEPDYTPQLQSEVLQIVQEGDHKLDDVGTNPRKSCENHSLYGQEEAVQYQRGMRKRLQFEAVSNCRITAGSKLNLCVLKSDVSNVESHGPSLDTEILNASSKEIALSSNKKLVESVCKNTFYGLPLKVCSCEQNKGGVSVVVPKPFSIGLHLNSIENIAAVNIKVDIHLTEEDVGAEVEKVVTTDNVQVKQYPKNLPHVRSLIGHQSAKLISSSDNSSPDSAQENNEEKDTGSHSIEISHHRASYQSSLNVKHLNRKLPLDSIDGYMTPCSMKRPSSEDAISTLSSQKSPKKKRKMKDPPENDGCKRCNCKRSKCLKLYCDCFAAGSCCSTACACLDCHNRPEHESIILETKQLIESRNPLAFAPKVVVHAANPPKGSGDSEGLTPTSVRHKRGCNCKKSQCLKKYCECYQAGVGCSLGCRCEGCKNTFGKKHGCDEIIKIEHKKSHKISLEGGPPVGKLEGIKTKRVDDSEHNYSRLSPLTPLLLSTSGNDASKLQLPAKYYPSPESGASESPPFAESPSPPVDSISSNMLVEEKGQTSSVVPVNQELGYRTEVPANSFSSGCDGFPDICKLGLLSNPSPQASDASASSKSRIPKTLQTRLLQGNSHLPVGIVFCRSSPATPQPWFGEGKFVKVPDSDSGLCKNQEDDTPEILQGTCSPIKLVTSPILDEVKPRFLTGCKFILQSVPSFPPLSPYSNNTKDHDGT